MKAPRVLVTGGAGFIGSHLSRALLARGCAVRVLDDLSMGQRANLPGGAEFLEGDIRDRALLDQALVDVDVVYHQAARVSIRASMDRFADDASVNVMGTLALLDALSRSSASRLVLASSMAVYADAPGPSPTSEEGVIGPLSPYGIGKLAAELYVLRLARDMGIRPVVLRYFNTYGPGQAFTPYVGVITIFIRRMLEGEPPVIFGDGGQRRDFVSVHDIVQANLLALDYAGTESVFNVGSGEARTVLEVATLLRDRIAPSLAILHADPHPGETRNSVADIGRAVAELGYRPSHRLEDSLDQLIAAVTASRSTS